MECELISALEELSKTRRELKKVKYVTAEGQDGLKQSLDETNKIISDLKFQLDEAKRIYEVTSFDLIKKEKEHQNLEEEIIMLRKELEKRKNELKMRRKYESNTKALDKILSN